MITYFKDSWDELRGNVHWLTRDKASNLMVVVAVFSVILALLTWLIDMLFNNIIQQYFSLFTS